MTFERDNIRRMAGYTSGEQPAGVETIKLNTNENPWPPSPKVQQALAAMDTGTLRRYPDPDANDFRDAAAELHSVARDNILATRGGDELLRLVITTFIDAGEVIAMSDPTYSLYPVLAQIQDARTLKIPLDRDWRLPRDFAARANAAGARLTFIVNPHAPSGLLLPAPRVADVARELDGLLVLDEAYVDFIDPESGYDAIGLIGEFDNIIILRSLSKGYSLAGLRFGYGIGPAHLLEPMRTKTRDSYNLDRISQQLAEIAIRDQAWAADTWQQVRAERERVRVALAGLGVTAPPSQSNFLLATVPASMPSARDVYLALKQRGILVRYFGDDRLDDKLRISIGTAEENAALISALGALAK